MSAGRSLVKQLVQHIHAAQDEGIVRGDDGIVHRMADGEFPDGGQVRGKYERYLE